MFTIDNLKLIEDTSRSILDPLGYDLIELKCVGSPQGNILRFIIDRTEGGITVGECAQLNKQLGEMIEQNNLADTHYLLEVSSPGLDRFLTSQKDFRRALNERIQVLLKDKQDDAMEYEGELESLSNEGIYIKTEKTNQVFIPFSRINKAKVVL